jgi:hypothetical protein
MALGGGMLELVRSDNLQPIAGFCHNTLLTNCSPTPHLSQLDQVPLGTVLCHSTLLYVLFMVKLSDNSKYCSLKYLIHLNKCQVQNPLLYLKNTEEELLQL